MVRLNFWSQITEQLMLMKKSNSINKINNCHYTYYSRWELLGALTTVTIFSNK